MQYVFRRILWNYPKRMFSPVSAVADGHARPGSKKKSEAAASLLRLNPKRNQAFAAAGCAFAVFSFTSVAPLPSRLRR